MTSTGLRPATFQLVAQRLKQLHCTLIYSPYLMNAVKIRSTADML
jgi:hypothetical protein